MFFFNDTATTEIYTLSLHDALPICRVAQVGVRAEEQAVHHPEHHRVRAHSEGEGEDDHGGEAPRPGERADGESDVAGEDRKSTRLNPSHAKISNAVLCLKKKKNSQV